MKFYIHKYQRKIIFFLSAIILGSVWVASEVKAFDRQVQRVQERLSQLGYSPGSPDGAIGAKTKSALKHFQVDNDLTITGRIDSATLSALDMDAGQGIAIQGEKGRDKRLALVIGNSAYMSAPLRNPANDANDMAAALHRIGFEVIKQIDADQETMETSLKIFGKRLRSADIGLFFFAGHGMQIEGANYLIPVGARISSESNVKYRAVNAGLVLGHMKDAGTKLNIVILDACRDNPYKRSFRTAKSGFVQMDAPLGSIIAYATSPGSVAADGAGRNGVFTEHLLSHITKPDLTVQDMFRDAGLGVIRETSQRQVPWTSATPIERFYLAGINTGSLSQRQPLPSPSIFMEAKLTITANVPGASIEINGKSYGKIPQTLTIKKAGNYHVRINKDSSWETWTEYVNITSGDNKTVDAYLKKRSKPDSNEYVQCQLAGERKPVWHKRSVCIKQKGTILNEKKTLELYRPAIHSSVKNTSKTSGGKTTYSDAYVQCILPGERKPVWHKESICKRTGGKTLDDTYVRCQLHGQRKPVWHKWSICEKMGGEILEER